MNKITKLITKFLNTLHLFLMILPILIFFVSKKLIKPYAHFILLITILVPLHWKFIDDKCLLTKISIKMGNYKNTQTDSAFTERNLRWLYEPIMRLFGWEWNNDGIDKMVTLHWIINIIIVWYFCFYYI